MPRLSARIGATAFIGARGEGGRIDHGHSIRLDAHEKAAHHRRCSTSTCISAPARCRSTSSLAAGLNRRDRVPPHRRAFIERAMVKSSETLSVLSAEAPIQLAGRHRRQRLLQLQEEMRAAVPNARWSICPRTCWSSIRI